MPRLRLLLPLDLGPEALFLRAELRRELLPEVLVLENLPDLELRVLAGHRIGAALGPLERLLHRLDLPDPEAGDELLRFGERPVDDGLLPAREAHALPLSARMEAFAGEHDSRLHQLLVELAHFGE